MPDDRPMLRQWRLLKMLSTRRRGVPLEEMAREAGVCVKTIRRDLAMFLDLGFPLTEESGEFNRKRWRIGPDWTEPHKHFTFDEAIALFLARRSFDSFAGTPFWEAANRAFDKIRAALTDDVAAYLERMADAFYHTHVGISDYARQREVIEALWIAVEDRRPATVTYSSRHESDPHTYAIHPYGMAFHSGSLYLVGYSPTHKQIRLWKVDRIAAAELRKGRFALPANFDLKRHFAGAFAVWDDGGPAVTVRVRFSPGAARYVLEKHWHGSEQFEPQGDGSLIAEFHLNSTVELKSWIFSFGQDAEILSPAELRENVTKELESLLARYKTASVAEGLPAGQRSTIPLLAKSQPRQRRRANERNA